MPNIYLKVTIEKNCLKTPILWVQKICHQVSVWGAPTHANITEF